MKFKLFGLLYNTAGCTGYSALMLKNHTHCLHLVRGLSAHTNLHNVHMKDDKTYTSCFSLLKAVSHKSWNKKRFRVEVFLLYSEC